MFQNLYIYIYICILFQNNGQNQHKNRNAIIFDLQAGESQRGVSITFKMSQPGVRKLWHKFLAKGCAKNLHRTGKSSKLTDGKRIVLRMQCIKEPFESAKCIYMRSNIDKNVSPCTIKRVLCSSGLFSRRAAGKPILTKFNVKKRKIWGKDYRNFQAMQ